MGKGNAMRLMLSDGVGNPSLLVTVKDDFDRSNFDFWVINGGWDGKFNNGVVTVSYNGYTSEGISTILSDDQKRLRGSPMEYQEVFDNFENPNYVGPETKIVNFESWDDDIAF